MVLAVPSICSVEPSGRRSITSENQPALSLAITNVAPVGVRVPLIRPALTLSRSSTDTRISQHDLEARAVLR